jgi:hypothetical protein
MTPLDAFLVTFAIGSGLVLVFVIAGIAAVTIAGWRDLLAAATAAFRRYAVRDMIVTAYYDPVNMRDVRRFELPEPYLVKVSKKHKEQQP